MSFADKSRQQRHHHQQGETRDKDKDKERGANRLAKRAKSFKDDFLEKITQKIRSPSSTRSTSPSARSNQAKGKGKRVEGRCPSRGSPSGSPKHPYTPLVTKTKQEKDIENARDFVKQLNNALRYLQDVVEKDKLEQLPGAASVLLEIVVSGYAELRAYLITNEHSSLLLSATNQVYQSLSNLIKWSDTVLIHGPTALDRESVGQVVKNVQEAVEGLVQLCVDRYQSKGKEGPSQASFPSGSTRHSRASSIKHPNGSNKCPVTSRDTTLLSSCSSSHRNSLPEISHVPREDSGPSSSSLTKHNTNHRPFLSTSSTPPTPLFVDKVHHSLSSDSLLNPCHERQPPPPPKPPMPGPVCDRPLSVSDMDPYSSDVPPPLPPKKRHSDHSRRQLGASQASIEWSTPSGSSRHPNPSISCSQASSVGSLLNMNPDMGRYSADDLLTLNQSENFDRRTRFDSLSEISHNHQDNNGIHYRHQQNLQHFNYSQSQCSKSFNGSYSSGFALRSPSPLSPGNNTDHLRAHYQIDDLIYQMRKIDTLSGGDEIDGPPELPVKLRSKTCNGSLANNVNNDLRPPSQYDNLNMYDFVAGLGGGQPGLETPGSWMPSNHSISCPHHLASHAVPGINVTESQRISAESSDVVAEKPPPLPPKKRNIMAYMQMVGSYCGPTDAALNIYRHSVHTYHNHQQQAQALRQVELSFMQRKTMTSSSFSSSNTTVTSSDESMFSSGSGCDSSVSGFPSKSVNNLSFNSTFGSNDCSVPPLLPPKRSRQQQATSFSKKQDSSLQVNLRSPVNPRTSSPVSLVPSSESGISSQSSETNRSETQEPFGPLEEVSVNNFLVFKSATDDGPDIRGGPVDALIVRATEVSKNDFLFQEAFLTTYRTFIAPKELVGKLLYRYNKFINVSDVRQKAAKNAFALLVRVVDDLCVSDCSDSLMQTLLNLVYQLVTRGDLALARVLRTKTIEKLETRRKGYSASPVLLPSMAITTKQSSLVDFKAETVAEQMTLLDSQLFGKIEVAEVLVWAKEQKEELIPNLNKFTEHFNKVSYWTRSRILEEEDAKDREKLVTKFIKVMKHLRKLNNFNSYLAILSALDSAPIRRLEWQRNITEGLKEYCALIDSSSSFRAYRQALAETEPPCIPYIGLILQDLTFVDIGNSDTLPDGNVNFAKRWQQFNILDQMRRFRNSHYPFKKLEPILNFFNNFDDYLHEESMWQISESIRPRGGGKK